MTQPQDPSLRRIVPGMSTPEIMSMTLGELYAAQVADQEPMRAYGIDFPGRGTLVVCVAVGDEHTQLLLDEIAKNVNTRRAKAGLPPREVPQVKQYPRKENGHE